MYPFVFKLNIDKCSKINKYDSFYEAVKYIDCLNHKRALNNAGNGISVILIIGKSNGLLKSAFCPDHSRIKFKRKSL